jgi:predicted component of viral defense system (DUF524 family)
MKGGLRYGLSAELGKGYQLVYNRTFSHGKGSGHSYSVSLRPDFSLMVVTHQKEATMPHPDVGDCGNGEKGSTTACRL